MPKKKRASKEVKPASTRKDKLSKIEGQSGGSKPRTARARTSRSKQAIHFDKDGRLVIRDKDLAWGLWQALSKGKLAIKSIRPRPPLPIDFCPDAMCDCNLKSAKFQVVDPAELPAPASPEVAFGGGG
jgi:hypothetical protein